MSRRRPGNGLGETQVRLETVVGASISLGAWQPLPTGRPTLLLSLSCQLWTLHDPAPLLLQMKSKQE